MITLKQIDDKWHIFRDGVPLTGEGRIVDEYYHKEGVLHDSLGPAAITADEKTVVWYKDDKLYKIEKSSIGIEKSEDEVDEDVITDKTGLPKHYKPKKSANKRRNILALEKGKY